MRMHNYMFRFRSNGGHFKPEIGSGEEFYNNGSKKFLDANIDSTEKEKKINFQSDSTEK